MRILVTNDDGIHAEGIRILAQAALAFGEVTVLAPATQCSAMSHRITLGRPLELAAVDFPVAGVKAYSLTGTPADCVKATLDVVLTEKPDLVLSGINHGYNVGYDIEYSGTVGAALEALMNGIPAIAVSRCDEGTFDTTKAYLQDILKELLAQPAPVGAIWNVNFPGGPAKGILRGRTPADAEYYSGTLYARTENGKLLLDYPDHLDVDNSVPRGPEGSDLHAVTDDYISIGQIKLREPV